MRFCNEETIQHFRRFYTFTLSSGNTSDMLSYHLIPISQIDDTLILRVEKNPIYSASFA